MKKIILLTVACLLWAGSAFGAEWWVDNSRENEEMTAMGTGTEKDPFNMTESLEGVVSAGDTVHLIGTNKPYVGGPSGKGLKPWIFGNCIVTKHETEKLKVIFQVTRKIPLSAMSGLTAEKTIVLPDFDKTKHRFYLKDDQLIRVSKDQLDKPDDGFLYDTETKVLTINTDTVLTDSKVREVIR